MTKLTAQAYTVAWLCALPRSELVVATAMLDEEHDPICLPTHDENSYTYGSINGHNVLIACMPPGQPGKVSALKLVQPLSQSFPNLKIHLFVGVGSGVPRIPPPDNPNDDIHLGDVVIGWAEESGVSSAVQWDPLKYLEYKNVESLGILDKPDRRLLNALSLLLRNRILGRTRFPEHLKRLQNIASFSHPGLEHDKLFKSTYRHVGGPNCSSCDCAQLIQRLPRVNQDLMFHQGTIVSGDTVMDDPERRDKISQIYHGALCFEMEAAGIMDDKRCLVIRGIADYADSHKDGSWKNYAAGAAAAFAREFLFTVQPQDISIMDSAANVPLPSVNTVHSNIVTISTAKVHFMVPFQRNGTLIGREKYIQSLEKKLCVPNTYCRAALVGLGGIGKSRIALEYASKYENSDSVSVFWVHATTVEHIEKAYQEIAKKARLAEAEDRKVDQFQLVKKWLESKDSGNWVMVIDNADDESLFFGEDEDRGQRPSNSSSKLARYFPQRPNGSILLTTRNRRLGVRFATARGVITISEMSISESKSLLLENLEEGSHNDHDLTDLVDVLENLPLALVQAAAFIGEMSQSIGDYLQLYRGSGSTKIKLLSQHFEDSERDPDIKNPVAVTWAISFEQIKKNNPRAADLLSLMSVLDRQAIPKALLSSDIEEVELEIALGTLKAFSFITAEQNRQAFNLHRLVHLAARNWLDMNEELESWTKKALVLLSERFPKAKYENREMWMAYLPHANTVLNSDQLPASGNIAQATLLINVSWALQQKGDYDSAEMMAQKSLDLRKKALGEKDLQTLRSLSNLALVFWRQDKNDKAEEIHRQALRGLEETLGKQHRYTLRIVNNLGLVLGSQGKYKEAENLHRRALSGYEKILKKDHPDTLTSVNNLARMLQKQERFEEAVILFQRALSGREKLFGKEHPGAFSSLADLAHFFHDRCQYQNALPLYQKAFAGLEKTLGSDHPLTQRCASNYSSMLEKMRRDSETRNSSIVDADS